MNDSDAETSCLKALSISQDNIVHLPGKKMDSVCVSGRYITDI
jgi:hypothetical protein